MLNYYDWLITIYRILRSSLPHYRDEEGIIENKLEADRILPPLNQIRVFFSKSEIVDLAKIIKCHSNVEYGKIPT